MNTVTDERILSKIAALLSKTVENGCTEAEALAAQSKAQEWIVKYNIDEIRLRSNSTTINFIKEAVSLGSDYHWYRKACLMHIIAKHNFCKVIVNSGEHTVVQVFGTSHNIDIVSYLYNFLVNEIRRLAEIAWSKSFPGAKFAKGKEGDKWYYSFAVGFNSKLNERLAQRRDALLNNEMPADCKALVICSEEDLEKAWRKLYPDTRTMSTNRTLDSNAYYAGQAAGSSVTVNPALSGH